MFGHVRQISELKCSKVKNIPHSRLDRVDRDLDVWLEESIERTLATNDPKDQLRDEAAVQRRYSHTGNGIIDQLGGKGIT